MPKYNKNSKRSGISSDGTSFQWITKSYGIYTGGGGGGGGGDAIIIVDALPDNPSATSFYRYDGAYYVWNGAWEKIETDEDFEKLVKVIPTEIVKQGASLRLAHDGEILTGQDKTFTFDTEPTALSDNIVTSGGVKQYVDDAVASVSGGANGIGVDSDGYLQLEKDGTAIEGQPKEVQPLAIQSLEDASKKYIHITTPQYDGNEEYLNGVVDTFTDALKTAFGENVDVNNIYYSFVPHVLANSGIATLDSSIHMMTMNANGSFIEFNGLQKFGWFKNITFGDVFTLNDTNSLGFQDEHGAFLMIDFSKIPTESITGLDLKFGEVAVADVGGRVITTTPTEASHAVNLNYANDHYTTKEYVDNRTLQTKVMTQSEYDGLTTKDENTMYIIIG